MSDDGGLQYWQQLGQQEQWEEEAEEWLTDPVAQAEYQEYLKSLERMKDAA